MPGPEAVSHPLLQVYVDRSDAGFEAVVGVVGDFERLCLVDGDDARDGAEYLLAGEGHIVLSRLELGEFVGVVVDGQEARAAPAVGLSRHPISNAERATATASSTSACVLAGTDARTDPS